MEMVKKWGKKRVGERVNYDLPTLFLLFAIAAGVIFGIHFFMLYCYNVYPFSDRVPSQYDLLAQIAPFAEHFFDVCKGEGSLFYSYRVGGGMDVFGTLVYCMVSPFSFLFWIFGEGNAWYATAWMLPAKMTCIAVSALVMIKFCFPEMHKAVALPVAIVYAYCGYVFVANTYINWMDFLIYLPLVIPAFRYMRRTGRIFPLSALIACCIYTCFSIACFSMLVSYPIFVAYAFFCVEKADRRGYLTKISLAYFCGVVAALPVMIPALAVYLNAGRNTGFFDSLWNEISALSYYRKLSYIFSDAFFVILTFYYFCKTRLSTKESRFLLVAGVFIMMPVLVDECCILMNMGSYMSYALRFGFLNAVYELYLACLVLQTFQFRKKLLLKSEAEGSRPLKDPTHVRIQTRFSPFDGAKWSKEKVQSAVLLGLFILLTAIVCVVIFETFAISQNRRGIDFSFWKGFSSFIESTKAASKNFAASFAHSTGGLEGILVLFGCVGGLSVVSIALYKSRFFHSGWLYAGMAVVLSAQTLFYGATLVGGNVFNSVRYQQYNTLYAQAMETEDSKPYTFRVKDYGAYLSDNQPLYTDTASYSVFSSLASNDNFAFNRAFGMGGNSVNTLKSRGGNLLGNCIIGNKYYFYNSEYDKPEEEGDRPTLSYDYLDEVARDRYFILYKNRSVYPSAYTVPAGNLSVTGNYDDYFTNMQNVYAFLGGEGSVFNEYTFLPSEISEKEMTDEKTGESVQVIALKLYLRISGDYTFCPDTEALAGVKYFTGSYSKDDLKDITAVKTFSYQNAKPSSSYSVYLVNDGSLTKAKVQESCTYKVITKETVDRLGEALWDRAVDYEMKSTVWATEISAKVRAQAGEQLFLNYVSLPGHKAYVNGKEVPIRQNGLNMLVIPLEEGENEVVIRYTSPYGRYALYALLAAVAILLVCAAVFGGEKGKKRLKAVETPVAVLALGLTAAVIAFFMIFPTGVFIDKIFFG